MRHKWFVVERPDCVIAVLPAKLSLSIREQADQWLATDVHRIAETPMTDTSTAWLVVVDPDHTGPEIDVFTSWVRGLVTGLNANQ